MEIGIFGNNYHEATTRTLSRIVEFLEDKGVQINICPDLYEELQWKYKERVYVREIENFVQNDVILSVGGDGTFLTTAALIGNREIPILGINTGHLGFLADTSDDEIEQSLTDLLTGNYEIDKRSALHVVSSDNTIVGRPYALNEIAVLKQDMASMIEVDVTLNNEPLNNYMADGLVISTPTGSTAYNLSVGGPLVLPESKNFVISPVATHSLAVRPLVIPDDWIIKLSVRSRSENYLISIDGRSQLMKQETTLTIEKADYAIHVIRTPKHNFIDTLRTKLLWGGRG